MFNRCCSLRSSMDYKLIHDPKPIVLSNNMDKIIKRLLWYVPNIDSYQSEKNELISEKLYDDFSFSYIIHKMRIIFAKTVKKYSLPDKKICLKQMIYLDILGIVLRTVNSL